MRSLAFTSELAASLDDVWAVVNTMTGVNAELGPWIKMTVPVEASEVRIDDAPVGRPLFSSWVLLGGVFPIDRHHFQIHSVDKGRAFDEDSTSWSQRRWRHRRELVALGEHACRVTDRLDFQPRAPMTGGAIERVIRAVFEHRHRRLRARFGERDA